MPMDIVALESLGMGQQRRESSMVLVARLQLGAESFGETV